MIFLGVDGKTQVSVKYINNLPKSIDTIVVSTQHSKNTNQDTLKKIILEEVIKAIIPNEMLTNNTKFLINPSGSFVLGGKFWCILVLQDVK